MSAATVLARGRAKAESLMVDACTITRRTGETTNTDTAAVTPTNVTVYSGKCRVQVTAGARARAEDVGEAYVRLLRLEVQLPMSVTGLAAKDLVTVTSSSLDADLVGRQFHIRELAHKTHATSRRIHVEEAT
jgi:hypothetical protein